MQSTPSAAGWQRRLNEASTEEAVVLVVNDFLARWEPEDIAQLLPDCKPGIIEDAAQVNSYALWLAHRHTIGVGEVSPMHAMATFFTRAALRIFQIDEVFSGIKREKSEGGRAAS